MNTKQRLPGDSDQAAAFALADIAAPVGNYPPDRVHADYAARMVEAGVDDDSGFLLRSLTRRYVLLETIWMQLARDSATPATAANKNIVYRNLSRLNEDLNKTLGLIHRVRLAQQENFAPFLSGEDQALVDDARPQQALRGEQRLTIPQIVQAEGRADDVFEAEFMEPKTKTQP